jgi:hypothetical protein
MELKNGIGRNNSRNTFLSIPKVRADSKTALATNAHFLDSVLKPRNYLPLPEPKRGRLIFLDPIAMVKKEIVSNIHYTTSFGRRPFTENEIFVFDSTPPRVHRLLAQRPS